MSQNNGFVNLHNHSHHGSLLDGYSTNDEYLSRAVEIGQRGLGMTDHGTLHGTYDLINKAKNYGITPVPGCLLKGQEIVTNRGMKPVEEIKVGDYVLTHKGRFRRVLEIMQKEYDGLGYEIQLNNKYSRTLTITEEHPILVRDRTGATEWVKPGDISFGRHSKHGGVKDWTSWVCLPKLEPQDECKIIHWSDFLNSNNGWGEENNTLVRRYSGRQSHKFDFPANVILDEDIAYLLGIYAAEGHVKFSSARKSITGEIGFAHHVSEQWIAEKIQMIVAKLGIRAKIYQRSEERRKNCLVTEIYNVPLANFFSHYVGRGAKNKIVPQIVMESPFAVRQAFLRGAIDGDGATASLLSNKSDHETYSTVSPHLAWGIKMLMADNGHFSSISSYPSKNPDHQTKYVLGYNPHRKYSRTLNDEKYSYKPISNIKEKRLQETVYNFEVEEDNSYVSDFILHNCEMYMAPVNPEGAKRLEPVYYGPSGANSRNDVSGRGAYLHLTMWAYNNEGLHNLFRLSSLSNDPSRVYQKPRIDFDLLADHSEGLIVSTGCPSSEISTRFRLGQDDKAYEYAGRLKEVFGERLFLEIMDHNMSIDLERDLLPKQLRMAKKMGIPLLATNDSHYAIPENSVSHEEMLCAQSGSRMSELPSDEGGSRFAFNGNQYYLKSYDEMLELFPLEDFPNALSNSLLITEMASDISLDYNPNLMAKPVIPEEFKDSTEFYKHLLKVGMKERYGNAPVEIKKEAVRRSKFEYEVIHSSNFIDYMLVVRNYLKWTKDTYSVFDDANNVLASSIGPGRGSVSGSIHAYMLGISEVDPIEHDLIFERFLGKGRGATYKITYDDGSVEEIIVSEEKNVVEENGETASKYIHQLKIGDTVEVENEEE